MGILKEADILAEPRVEVGGRLQMYRKFTCVAGFVVALGFAAQSAFAEEMFNPPGTYDTATPIAGPYISAAEIGTSPTSSFDVAPTPLNAPHACRLTFYLQSAIESGEEGSTFVDFTIGSDGHVKNAVVARSSGWEKIDHVATECVVNWLYRPATKNNEPVDAQARAKIVVQMDFKGGANRINANVTRPTPRRVTPCVVSTSDAKLQPPVVAMTVNTLGDVDDPAIEQSSGDPEVDKIVLDCVKKWEFNPATQFGRPLIVRTRGAVRLLQGVQP
jgi:TonB family protein